MLNYQTKELTGVARMFQALSNPHRLSIFMRLVSCCRPGTRWTADANACACVGELGQDLGIAPSTLSHHVKELRDAGLIRMERRGKRADCWADPDALRRIIGFLQPPDCGAKEPNCTEEPRA